MKTIVLTITAVVALACTARAQIGNEFGSGAGNGTLTGSYNTGNGNSALQQLTSADYNAANGAFALQDDTTGLYNTANGAFALQSNTSGIYNTANGVFALQDNTTGGENTADGDFALQQNTTGIQNTAVGWEALAFNPTGTNNIAVGYLAGSSLTNGDNNIDIGNDGVADEAGTIRIGTEGVHTNTYVAGISGVNLTNGTLVAVSSDGQLGTVAGGAGLVSGAYLTLPTNAVAPAGFTLLGTTSVKYKADKKTKTIDVDLYQKD